MDKLSKVLNDLKREEERFFSSRCHKVQENILKRVLKLREKAERMRRLNP